MDKYDDIVAALREKAYEERERKISKAQTEIANATIRFNSFMDGVEAAIAAIAEADKSAESMPLSFSDSAGYTYPCTGCDKGWGSASGTHGEFATCNDTCEKWKRYAGTTSTTMLSTL